MPKLSIIWVYLYKEVSVSKVGETLNLWIYILLCIDRHILHASNIVRSSYLNFLKIILCIFCLFTLVFMTMFRPIYSPGFLYCLNLPEIFFSLFYIFFELFHFFNALFPLLCCLGFLKSMTLPMVYKSRSVFFFGTITLKSCDFISLLY